MTIEPRESSGSCWFVRDLEAPGTKAMPIAVKCPCGVALKAPDNLAGKAIKCPKCQAVVKIPAAGAAAAPAAPQPRAGLASAAVKQAPGAATAKAPVKKAPGPATAKAPPPPVEELDELDEVNEKAAPTL